MLTHSRFVPFGTPADNILATEDHVRAHLSAVASPDDDEQRYADEVEITHVTLGTRGIRISGTLDRDADAPYLRDDWDPEQDVADNPLSVPSIEEGQ